MTKKTLILIITIFFFTTLAIDIYGVSLSNKELEMLCKPMLMVLLATFYYLAVAKPNFFYLSALFFSFWGDVLLLFEEKFFIFGLASFLVAHLFYIKLTSTYLQSFTIKKYVKKTIPFVLFFAILIFFIKHNLGEFLVPVIVYGLVISVFGTFTLLNYSEQKSKSNNLLLLGGVLFILSDSFIALNKFLKPSVLFDVGIILFYAVSQYILCLAVIRHQKEGE